MESTGQGRVCGLTRFDMCERCIGNAFLSKKDTDFDSCLLQIKLTLSEILNALSLQQDEMDKLWQTLGEVRSRGFEEQPNLDRPVHGTGGECYS